MASFFITAQKTSASRTWQLASVTFVKYHGEGLYLHRAEWSDLNIGSVTANGRHLHQTRKFCLLLRRKAGIVGRGRCTLIAG